MEKEKFIDQSELDKERIVDVAKKFTPLVICYLAKNNDHYPRCCREACSLLGLKIKEETGLNGLKMCRGSVTTFPDERYCSYHAWLEYGDVIIDPMDFQFNTADEDDLPLTEENYMPEDVSKLNGLTQDEFNEVCIQTWLANTQKRYLENPNEKEKYFQYLNELLKTEKIDLPDYYLEIKRCFGIKTFYDKSDKNRVYEADHIEPVILNKTLRMSRRAIFGKW